MSSAAIEELDQLLREPPDAAAARARARLPVNGAPIVLYGAGTLGTTVANNLRAAGIEPAAFADDTPEKQGMRIAGVAVMPVREAASRFGKEAIFVVTILNPLLRFVDARTRLRGITDGPVVSFLDVAWMHPEEFLPYYQFELPQDVLRKRDRIALAASRFADDESRRQFAAQLRFRLHLDYDALPENSHDDYFPDLLPRLDPECVFVDCGAFDGDSVRKFLEVQNGRFGEVYAFEPDQRNCERLRASVESMPRNTADRIHVHAAAVGDARGKLRFNMTGNMSASLSNGGGVDVDVVRVDDIVPVTTAQTYVKYDVEGGEWEALRGTQRLLEGGHSLLAVSIYHRPDDLWELPLYLDSLDLGYDLYLRTQGEDGMDVICYAIPPA
ncbi:MAG TPA: FkbM family methyltransferase [Thermoanaerobaculia bacterium]|jgi:FkbM family methyltransferase|nr:FkbM family methyltransferase [Thermoanaerobaculia bacterium]